VTAQWNCEALTRLRLNPRVMVDVSKVNTTIKLLGRELPHPILLAPTALHLLVHPEAELETARGAGAAKSIMVASTGSNRTIGEICQVATQPVWFQLYVQSDRAITKDLIERAAGAGCQALCVTVDQPVLYNRDRVLRLGPFAADLPMGNYRRTGGSSFAASAPTRSREITWRDLEWFKSLSKLPVFLKGILHPDDAEMAVKGGVDGIVASNHGGRALDSCPATIDALPRIVDRVGGRVPILMDGGIRRGTDVLKAIGLGATAVLIGRPYLFGLAVNGAEGVRHVVEILRSELEAAMALTGCTSIPAIDRSVIYPGP
jgi:4-hydroxymandelate oxidase